MASFRPFASQPTFLAPPQPPQQHRVNQYSQSYPVVAPPPPPLSSIQQPYHNAAAQHNLSHPLAQQQYFYRPPLPPPPQATYHASSRYNQQHTNQLEAPPLPPVPPPSSSIPPPPPPLSSSIQPPPPPNSLPPSNEVKVDNNAGGNQGRRKHELVRDEDGDRKHVHKSERPALQKRSQEGLPRVETEEERRLRKKRDYEKRRQEEKHKQHLKETQKLVLQKTQMLSAQKGIGGSRMADVRATPLLGGERMENRLKKPTTFLCRMKFRNELPDPSAQPKFMTLRRDDDRFTKYAITSLEKKIKPKLFVESDLGIPLDLLDLSAYNNCPSVKQPLDPEDEALFCNDESSVTPLKKDGIRRKERPSDETLPWLVKTQYISSMESTKQSVIEKRAKEPKGGRNLLETFNDRERQIQEIEASFEANKLAPVHATNKKLLPIEIMPLIPDFDRLNDKFVLATFDGAPTVDSEMYSKFDESVRDSYESHAIMKACVTVGSETANEEKFLAYMLPSLNELGKDVYDEREDISYSWIREYHWNVRGDDVNDPTTFLISYDEDKARYLPLPTKISLRKKKAREGRSWNESPHFPVPSKVTVRCRSVAATIETSHLEANSNSRDNLENSRIDDEDEEDEEEEEEDIEHFSRAEDDLLE